MQLFFSSYITDIDWNLHSPINLSPKYEKFDKPTATNYDDSYSPLLSRVVLKIRTKVLWKHMEKLEKFKEKRLDLDQDSLRWTPLVVSGSAVLEEELEVKREVF